MRKAGILLPITSLPSPHGVGALGRAAFDFVDFLAAAGQSLWQVLPLGPTGYGDSPYASFSAFAGNPYFIDLDILCGDGLLARDEIGDDWGGEAAKTDYGLLYRRRFEVLALACARLTGAEPAYRAFVREYAHWLEDYALFMALKEAHGGGGFAAWPEALRRRRPGALRAAKAQCAPRVEFWRRVQYLFFAQWMALKSYATARGVALVGDIPIYVSDDSADLWANPELFQLDAAGRPARVAGVPPDAFSADGQLWGNPLYDWPAHQRSHYAWWLARLAQSARLFDDTRIDHFRGFASYYAIPAGAATAKKGRWVKGPGRDFIAAVRRALPDMRIIAEDLGYLTREVRALLAYSRYPGMKVLQFAFDSREESDYLPHNYNRHTVVYTGTHDNTTAAAWQRQARPEDAAFARLYLGLGPRGRLGAAMVRAALASVADTAIVPMQDWLGLGAAARFNTPSTLGGDNWRWRLVPGQLTPELAARIRLLTRSYGRLSEAARTVEAYAKKAMRVLTSSAMKAAEAAAVAAGGSYEALMESAGRESALAIEALAAEGGLAHSALMLCGKGNNAGDAFVAARLLLEKGWRVRLVCLMGEAFSPLAALNRARLPAGLAAAPQDIEEAAVLVDGVFGTGFHGALPEAARLAFARANAALGLRVALDVPSGLDCDSGGVSPGAFRARHTLTFGAYKPGLLMAQARPYVGELRCLDIGL